MKYSKLMALGAVVVGVAVVLTACDDPKQTTQYVEEKQTESNQQRLASATPPPQFDHSLERENLTKRLNRINVQNKVGYVYLFSLDGNVVAFYMIKGKVSSLNSYLTTPQQVVFRQAPVGGGYSGFVVDSPDFDGSYGKNPEGIFFFTADSDAYVEWSGSYLYADKPLKITSAVKLEATVDLEKQGK